MTEEEPAQQEPVGVVNIESHSTHGWKVADFELTKALPFGRHLLYTSPPAQRKPLTPTEVHGMAEAHGIDGDARHWYVVGLVDAQAKHNIKENT